MLDLTSRFTRRCSPGTYRVPVLAGNELYVIETNDCGTIREQQNKNIPNAFLGEAINRLGEYESLGYTPEELKKMLGGEKSEKVCT